MSHYFINDENLKSNIKKVNYSFKGIDFNFSTDTGIFSYGETDDASKILITNIPELSGSMLDLGCGYGFIGICLSKVYNLYATFVDVNLKALELTKTNCKNNNVNGNIFESDGFSNIKHKSNNIVINPPIHAGKKIVYDMYENSIKHLEDGGSLFIVIRKKHGAETTINKLTEIYNNCNILYKKKGIFVVQFQKK